MRDGTVIGPGMTQIDREDEMQVATTLSAGRTLHDNAAPRPHPVLFELNRNRAACSTCTLRELCLTEGLDAEAMSQIDELVSGRIRLHRGDTLFRAGDRFTSLYSIRSGSCKTISLRWNKTTQVPALHFRAS